MKKEEAFNLLVKQNVLSQEQADEMNTAQVSGDITTFLLQKGIAKKALLEMLHVHYNTPSFDMQGVSFHAELLELFVREALERYCFIPLKKEGDRLSVIAADPTNQAMKNEIEESGFKNVSYLVGLKKDIFNAIETFYPEEEEGDEQEQQEEKEDDK